MSSQSGSGACTAESCLTKHGTAKYTGLSGDPWWVPFSSAAHFWPSTGLRSRTSIQASGALQMGRFQQSCRHAACPLQLRTTLSSQHRQVPVCLQAGALPHMNFVVHAPGVKVLIVLPDGCIALQRHTKPWRWLTAQSPDGKAHAHHPLTLHQAYSGSGLQMTMTNLCCCPSWHE